MKRTGNPTGKPTTPAPANTPTINIAEVSVDDWVHEEGRDLFFQLLERLQYTTTDLDIPALNHLCNAYGISVEAARKLNADGISREDERHIVRRSPHFQIWRDALAMFNSLASQFGLTPASRNKAQPTKDKLNVEEMLAALEIA